MALTIIAAYNTNFAKIFLAVLLNFYLMPLFVLGLNHVTAPIALRERVAFAPTELTHVLQKLHTDLHPDIQIAILSTCNRTEVYVVLDDSKTSPMLSDIAQKILAWLAEYHDVDLAELSAHTYIFYGTAAVAHSFSVASGMDSMVLGEPQILGQMKQATRLASLAGTYGTGLQQWFDKSFAVAKEVRTLTGISEHSVSMAAAAVKLARHVFDDFTKLNVLLVGAGEMMEVVAAHIASQIPAHLTVANRSLEKACEIISPYTYLKTNALRLAELHEQLTNYDVVITCTASTLPIIGLGMVETALKLRRHRPIVMVDLGVPRDIEAAIGKINDVFLYTVDDLSAIVQNNSMQRTAALVDAQKIVNHHVAQFNLERTRRSHASQVQTLRQRAKDISHQELKYVLRPFKQREHISVQELEDALQLISHRLTNKLLHQPTIGLQSHDSNTREAWQKATLNWLTQKL